MGLSGIIRSGWWSVVCALALSCAPGPVRFASAAVKPLTKTRALRRVEQTPWEQAERGRQQLEAMPRGTRTRADYTRAMDGFRAVYHDAPGDMHAPDSVNAVAELLTEVGRELHDAKSLKAAVGQYDFLRTQYPGSSLRVGALLAEGEIYANDLHDTSAAREAYARLVSLYPKSERAEEARAGLEALKAGSSEEGAGSRGAGSRGAGTSSGRPATQPAGARGPIPGGSASTIAAAGPSGVTAQGEETPGQGVPVALHVAASGGKKRGPMAQVTGIRHWSTPDYTRVAIDLGDDVTYEAARVPNPDRIYFDLHGTRLSQDLVGKSFAVTDDGFLKKIRAAQFSNDMTRVVLDVNDVTEYSAFLLPNPYRLIIDIHGGAKAGTLSAGAASSPVVVPRAAAPAPSVPNTTAVRTTSSFEVAALSAEPGKVQATSQPTSQPISAVVKEQGAGGREEGVAKGGEQGTGAEGTEGRGSEVRSEVAVAAPGRRTRRAKMVKDPDGADAVPARAAAPTADGETSLVRALGLKIGRIVIDAGHGGHDSGTLGVDGIEEKDVVLDVALRLGRLLHDRLGSEIIYTRSDDTFIPLETRTAIANKAQADLFLSIHANSSSDASARGVETYYLNFTTSPDALETAARENAVSDQSIHQLSDLVKKIALKNKIAESREFAGDVEQGLYGGLQKGNAGLKDRGVKKAPFVVLIGANMPSVLAEISFVTNAKDARQLQEPEYRERVAESLYRGVSKYEQGLSGVKMPTERASREGQGIGNRE
ncbi:MAG: N-acetylmuramoyl-L-alanine amidase [Acidobacteriota bacterium]|nr:N-acetylmuramoyl-L-alanine amidase [Acidobacteriota bacterium]